MPDIRRKRLGVGTVPPPSPAPRPLVLRHTGLSFSFKFFLNRPPFDVTGTAAGYLLALLERLRDLSALTPLELKTSRSNSLRCHPIAWADTSEANGFDHLNSAIREEIEPYQFSISANAHGRAHGFFIDDVFYVVWLDPAHQLYPGT